jgi:hypothetical protein
MCKAGKHKHGKKASTLQRQWFLLKKTWGPDFVTF